MIVLRRCFCSSAAATKRAFLFPGQGSQRIGMGLDLLKEFPSTKETFQEADETLSLSLSKLMFEGDLEQLTLTENAQPAILIHSIAIFRVLLQQTGFSVKELCSFGMGHSLGEYSALCAAGALSFKNAVRLVRQRGLFMKLSETESVTAMVAVMPLSELRAAELCRNAQEATGAVCEIAAINSKSQIVLSGHQRAIDVAVRIGQEGSDEGRIRRVTPLSVSAPFHSSLMKPAALATQNFLNLVPFQSPVIPIVSNLHGDLLENPDAIKTALVQVMTRPVQWQRAIDRCVSHGANQFVEVGSSALTSFLGRSAASHPLKDALSLGQFLKSF